ncbi:MAG: hypothetical protein S4CHLAM102_02490 [Chlamydiia bacterium]|nr:hypothetical protein [Chlamydiia bacterium]
MPIYKAKNKSELARLIDNAQIGDIVLFDEDQGECSCNCGCPFRERAQASGAVSTGGEHEIYTQVDFDGAQLNGQPGDIFRFYGDPGTINLPDRIVPGYYSFAHVTNRLALDTHNGEAVQVKGTLSLHCPQAFKIDWLAPINLLTDDSGQVPQLYIDGNIHTPFVTVDDPSGGNDLPNVTDQASLDALLATPPANKVITFESAVSGMTLNLPNSIVGGLTFDFLGLGDNVTFTNSDQLVDVGGDFTVLNPNPFIVKFPEIRRVITGDLAGLLYVDGRVFFGGVISQDPPN